MGSLQIEFGYLYSYLSNSMECLGKIKKGKKTVRCMRRCSFFYCPEHWKLIKHRFFGFYISLNTGWKTTVKIVAGLVLAYEAWSIVSNYYAKCGEKDHISGKLLPIKPRETEQYFMDIGAKANFTILTKQLEDGFEVTSLPTFEFPKFDPITHTIDFNNSVKPMNLMLKIKDEKLCLSVTLIDFNGDIIGRLKDNKWEVKNNIADCDDGDNHLEVLDKQGNVAFRLEVDSASVIHLRGYFIKDSCAIYLTDKGMIMSSRLSAHDFDSTRKAEIALNPIKYCKFYINN
jgi:hypothetical protein